MSEAGMGTGTREEEKGVVPAEKGTLGLLVPFTCIRRGLAQTFQSRFWFGLSCSTSASPALDQHISAPEKGGPFVVGLIHVRNLSTKPNTAAWDNEGLSASFDVALEHSLPLSLEFWAFKLRRFIGGSILHWDRKLDLQNVFLMRYKGSNALSKDECAGRCFISEVFPVGTNTNDALPSFIKGRAAPNKDESARRGFIGEVFLIGTNTKNVPLTCIKGPDAPSKDESACPCFIGEIFLIG
ncbi:hypothetical protein DFH07DRAFT_784250 [Mycena maculata]|uniref:Uncharacterized protein n=1 Tax=Mycena maculata TaxID=230809 RepID=A0AAD7HHM5_9AGAR|nr:hypothetical protein DFH07DRAFT_784250 [Mycena maculata]